MRPQLVQVHSVTQQCTMWRNILQYMLYLTKDGTGNTHKRKLKCAYAAFFRVGSTFHTY